MAESDDLSRDLGSLVVPAAGALAETGDPYCLTGPDGGRVEPVSEFVRDLQAAGRSATTQRSYALALLRWFRFTWAVGVPWDQATRTEARDFCRWIQLVSKPGRPRAAAAPVPGKRPASVKYASSTVAHCETVCRGFYSYHLEAGTGPIVNPFPIARAGRAGAHRNPMDPFPRQGPGCSGRGYPAVSRGRSLMRCSASCSPGCPRTGTGRWSRSGCPPARVPRSCSAFCVLVLIPGSS